MTPALLAVLLAAPARAAAVAVRPADFERFSLLTAPGPDEPPPELLTTARRLLYFEHHAERGETSAGRIARTYGTTERALKATNNNEFIWAIRPGTPLTVLNRDGRLYEVRKATETLDEIVAGASAEFSPGGDRGRRRLGVEERRLLLKELIVKANNLPGVALLAPYEFEQGDRLLVPNVNPYFDTYHYPVIARRISSGFGSRFHPILKRRRMHEGMDIPKPYGTWVYPARDGVVVEAGWHEGYGQMIVIRHKNGDTTRYGHLSRILVRPGDRVRRDLTRIGRVGSTGISTGPHLHFEIRDRDGNPVNPYFSIGKSAATKRRRK